MKTRYVCGFLFSLDLAVLVLIKKRRPECQAGLYNGVGGKMREGELLTEAMAREFLEETGLAMPPHTWVHFHTIDGHYGDPVFFLSASSDRLSQCESITDEPIAMWNTRELHALESRVVHNIPWLVALAVDTMQQACANRPLVP